MKTFFLIKWNISLVLLAGITTFYACKSDDRELQGEPVPQVQKPNDISEINLETKRRASSYILPMMSVLRLR